MKLNNKGLENKNAWEAAGYALPQYDREAVAARTKQNPFWIHFGAGNIFRAFQANVVQDLLNKGDLDRGLVVAEGYDYEIVEKMNHPHDDYSILVTLKANGTVEKTVVGSVMESLALDSEDDAQFSRLKEIFSADSLQMATFTITEKGYNLYGSDGNFMPAVAADMAAGPQKPASYIGKVASLLYARFLAGEKPIAMVSMDNCSHNGDKLAAAITAFAEGWVKNGLADEAFETYVKTSGKVSFPWTMIDKITPAPGRFHRGDLKERRRRGTGSGCHQQKHLCGAFCQRRGMPVSRHRRQLPERSSSSGKGRSDLYHTGDRRQSRENEGLHLLKPAPHRACCLRLPARLQLNLQGDEESFFKEAC